jgi:hypothetical protein
LQLLRQESRRHIYEEELSNHRNIVAIDDEFIEIKMVFSPKPLMEKRANA